MNFKRNQENQYSYKWHKNSYKVERPRPKLITSLGTKTTDHEVHGPKLKLSECSMTKNCIIPKKRTKKTVRGHILTSQQTKFYHKLHCQAPDTHQSI